MDTTETVAPEQTLNAPVAQQLPPTEQTPTDEASAEPQDTPENVADQPEESEEDKASKELARMERKFTRRIDRLTAKHAAAAAEAGLLRDALRQYAPEDVVAAERNPQPARPEDVLALAERIASQRLERERVVSSIKSVLSAGREIEGFDAACNTVNEELPFYDQNGAPTPFLQVVIESDAPAKVLHYLGSNPDLAAELAGLSVTQQARRIARIEAELAKPPAPKVSNAPKPIAPVRASSRDDGGLSDNLTTEEWARRFRERMSKR